MYVLNVTFLPLNALVSSIGLVIYAIVYYLFKTIKQEVTCLSMQLVEIDMYK